MPYRTVLLGLISLAVFTAPVGAQVNLYETPLGALYVSPYPDRYVDYLDTAQLSPGVPFKVYLVAEIDFDDVGAPEQNVSNGLSAWEASVHWPAHFFVLAAQKYPETSIDFGSSVQGTSNYLVGTGSTVPVGDPFVLIEYDVLIGNHTRDWIRVGPVTTIPSVTNSAAWLEAAPANGCEINGRPSPCLFRFYEANSLYVGNRSNEATSFGAMKARYE